MLDIAFFLPSLQECVLGYVPADSAHRYASAVPIKKEMNYRVQIHNAIHIDEAACEMHKF